MWPSGGKRGEYIIAIVVNDSKTAVEQGLPHGSVLAPLLFLFYINGLQKVVILEQERCWKSLKCVDAIFIY